MWSSLNSAVLYQYPDEAIQFMCKLPRLLCTILFYNPCRGPIFMSKIDLYNTYMRV